ncbi:MAG: hypothetical protein ACFE9A_20100, partial [Candidatus Hodarchaeota archaeon]
MKKVQIRSAIILAFLLYTNVTSFPLNTTPVNTSPLSRSETSSETPSKDILIINDPNKQAYFGWYKPTSFSFTIWELLNRTVLWASSYSSPNETKVVFFRDSLDTDAIGVYEWLISGGYLAENIELHPTADTEILHSNYYDDSDLVIYWNTYGYNSTNIVISAVPFITVSAMQTDEMGIGSGSLTKRDANDT